MIRPRLHTLALAAALALATGCAGYRPGTEQSRKGDEIMVCGRLFHTGVPVVLWTDPGGYDAYRVERRFSPLDDAGWEAIEAGPGKLESPNRFGLRREGLTDAELERVRGGGWDLPTLQRVVDQFVLHYDASGTSRRCFQVLHDRRGLSVHFLLDVDGTLYQSLDLKERAWHATTSNSRSVGIEIAQPGAVPAGSLDRLDGWYTPDSQGVRLVIPADPSPSGIRQPDFVGRPARPEPITGSVQGRDLVQYDFTPEQYRTLARLAATLCRVFPRIRCDAPRDDTGRVAMSTLPDADLEAFSGILGHFHIQRNKVDPGPAFDWERFLAETRRQLTRRAPASGPPEPPATQTSSR